MDLPISELLALTISLMLSAVGFGVVKGRKPEVALMTFVVGLFISSMVGLIPMAVPIILMVVLVLLLGRKYSRGD